MVATVRSLAAPTVNKLATNVSGSTAAVVAKMKSVIMATTADVLVTFLHAVVTKESLAAKLAAATLQR